MPSSFFSLKHLALAFDAVRDSLLPAHIEYVEFCRFSASVVIIYCGTVARLS